MKNLFFTFLALILLMPVAWAQCPTGNLDFMTQQQIDDFAVQYPNCTQIPGTVMINGYDVFDLRPFSNVTSIGGSLLILNNPDLTHLTGFENLTSVGSSVTINNNASLVDVFGLDNLGDVPGNVTVTDNTSLDACFLAVTCFHYNTNGSVYMGNNGPNCIGDYDLYYNCLGVNQFYPSCLGNYTGNFLFTSQAQLDEFSPNCGVLIGNVTISGSDITNFGKLSQMSGIIGELAIENNPLLTTIKDLDGWNFLTLTNLRIQNNPLLVTCGMETLCRYLEDGGTATINSNSSGCTSTTEIMMTCDELDNCPLSYNFFTQADVDNFPILYPDCSVIGGNLNIGDFGADTYITDLSPLSQLTQIQGYLNINDNDFLTNLNGLNSITTIGGNLNIANNDILENLAGLENLATVGGSTSIRDCHMITDLTGLENLTTVNSDLSISFNNGLLNFDGLENLTTVVGSFFINNNALTSISSLQNLTTAGSLWVTGNDVLPNLNGLQNLTTVNEDLWITSNDMLSELDALQNLTSIGENLTINSNDLLPYLDGLENLTTVGGNLEMNQNSDLIHIQGLQNLTSIGGRLWIRNVNNLNTLTGLENLTSIGALLIGDNPTLMNLDALTNVNSSITELDIYNNPLLSACSIGFICEYLLTNGDDSDNYVANNASGCEFVNDILNNCNATQECPSFNVNLISQQQVNDFAATYPNCTQIDGLLQIGQSSGGLTNINDLSPLSFITSVGAISVERTNITNLSGLEGIQNVADDMKIILNPKLNTLNALNGMTNIGGQLYIAYNKKLIDLEGLNQMTTLGSLRINNNIKLTSLLALGNLQTVPNITIWNNPILPSIEGLHGVNIDLLDHLSVSFNPLLETCSLSNICEYLEDGGSSYILSNAAGCNSPTDIETFCVPASDCTNDIILQTQQQVNDFATTYNCNELTGILYIGKTSGSLSNITDLTPLNQIESVGGISIQRTGITHLGGLEQLQTVTGDLRIVLNPNLVNLYALNNVMSVGGQLHIGYNKELVALTGLNQLNQVGNLRINNNKKLTDLSDLINMQIASEIIIQNNQNLASLTGLEGLDLFAPITNVTITSNPLLSDCAINAICQHLTNQGSNLIANNATGCATSSEVADACMLNPTCSLGAIYLLNQQAVNDFAAAHSSCSIIDGSIYIGQSSGNLNDITDLSPLDFITQIETIEIRRTRITDLSGLEQLQTMENLVLELNPNLVNINALSNLQSVGNFLNIGFNRELLTLDGLEGLNSIGTLYIRENKKLMSLEALSNLTEVTQLLLHKNQVLTSLAGLENINPNTLTYIELSLHDQLSACSIAPICTHLTENPNNNYWIIANAEGCATQAEILDNCISTPPPSDSCETVTETHVFTFDNDLCINGVGFANNPNITFTDPATPANAVLSDITMDLFFRMKGISCEQDITIKVTDPAGNVNVYSGLFVGCNNVGLYQVSINIASANTTGNMDDWLIEFDDTDDQNTGDEYSLRFARLTYTTTATTGEGILMTNQVSDFADFDLYIDGVGFANNDTYTFTDPGTPADATLSNISLELYFKLNGASCENEIAIQITDPAGNTQALTAFTTCIGGTDLYFANLDVPSGNTTGNTADWVVEFDDTNDQNTDYEYSVRFGRLTYTAEYIECMEMLANEINSESQQLNNSSTQHPVNSSIHQLNNSSTQQPVNSSIHQLNNSLKLYPVPTSQHLNVAYFSEKSNSANIEIISNEGKTLMLQEEFLQEGMNTIQLDINDLPVGYYFIRMYSAEDVQVQPFVKVIP